MGAEAAARARLVLSFWAPGEPKGKEANGTPDWSALTVERTLHSSQASSVMTCGHLLRVPEPLPLCTPQCSKHPLGMWEDPSSLAAHPPSHLSLRPSPCPRS